MNKDQQCGSRYKTYGIGMCTCTLRLDHQGVHEDETVGVWWLSDNQLEES